MTGTVLFALSVAIYAGLPLLMAIRHSSIQLLMLYSHLAAVLTIGGILGAVYALPLPGGVTLLAGQVAYGGFMFATLITVVLGRNVQVVRNIIVLVVSVNVVVFTTFKVTHLALTGGRAPNVLGVDAAVFDQSLDVVLLGGFLIILELLTLLAALELAKRHLSGRWFSPVIVVTFVAILTIDGVLFPALVLRPGPDLGQAIASSVPAKLVLAAAFAVPLVLFLALYTRLVRRFELTPLDLTELVPGRHHGMVRQLKQKEVELAARTAEAGRATATVNRILDAATNTMLVATDPDLCVTHYSLGAQALLGHSQDEVLGRSLADFIQPDELGPGGRHEGPSATLLEVLPLLAREGAHRDWAVPTKSGEDKVLSLNFTEIRDCDVLMGYLCAGEDVTGRLRAEQALSEALRREHEAVARLQDADRVKDEVVSTISHELRTPLASIRGYSEVLADGDLGALNTEQADALVRVQRNAGRLASLVEHLLHLDRAEAASTEPAWRVTDLVQVARGACDGLEELVHHNDVRLVLDVPDHAVGVRGERDALERVVVNLADNAIKFTPAGGAITLSIGRQDDCALITVADTGVGIASGDQDKVFERFFRSSAAFHHAVPGTGLGLAVVQQIVAAHHGTLAVDSTPGVGTTVTVLLPMAEVVVEAPVRNDAVAQS